MVYTHTHTRAQGGTFKQLASLSVYIHTHARTQATQVCRSHVKLYICSIHCGVTELVRCAIRLVIQYRTAQHSAPPDRHSARFVTRVTAERDVYGRRLNDIWMC